MNTLISLTPDQQSSMQVMVWPACIIESHQVEEMIEFLKKELYNTDFIYLGQITTTPGQDGEGGRTDQFIAFPNKDSGYLAVRRIGLGMRWVEDYISNGALSIVPLEMKEIVLSYRNW